MADCGMATDILVENDFKKNLKNPVCENVVLPLANRVKNLIEKNDPVCQTALWPLAGLIENLIYFWEKISRYVSVHKSLLQKKITD